MQTENYKCIFEEENNIPIIYEISDKIEIENINQEYEYDKVLDDKLYEKLKNAIGEEKLELILNFYHNLVDDNQLTDSHSDKLSEFINDTCKEIEKDKYIQVRLFMILILVFRGFL